METGYLHLVPSGLDDRSRAKASSTPVAIEAIGLTAVRSISNLANGKVPLRARATGASGASISETVTDAYGTG